jgi:hypothetical protein
MFKARDGQAYDAFHYKPLFYPFRACKMEELAYGKQFQVEAQLHPYLELFKDEAAGLFYSASRRRD